MLDAWEQDTSMGLPRDLGQASEVRRGGLKLGFAMQTLEGNPLFLAHVVPVLSIRVRQG